MVHFSVERCRPELGKCWVSLDVLPRFLGVSSTHGEQTRADKMWQIWTFGRSGCPSPSPGQPKVAVDAQLCALDCLSELPVYLAALSASGAVRVEGRQRHKILGVRQRSPATCSWLNSAYAGCALCFRRNKLLHINTAK